MMAWFRYDFGYAWPWTSSHVLLALLFAVIATVLWRRGARRWLVALMALLMVWALAGALIVHGAFRFSLPLRMPTAAFLPQGGRVLDLGAGSGRASVMVLQSRPQSRVVALDLFSEKFGIDGNSPDRLRANAAVAAVDDRLEIRTGDMRTLDFPPQSFDGVISAYAIDHLRDADVRQTLAGVARVLRPGGDVLLFVVNPDVWLRVALPLFFEHGYFGGRPRPELWRERLTTAGFTVVEMGHQPGALYLLGRTATGSAAR